MLRASLSLRGIGAPSRRAFSAALSLTAISVATLILAASASADSALAEGQEGFGAGQFAFPSAIAVSRQSGDFYVVDKNRVSEFHSDGTFVRTFGAGVATGAAEPQICGPGATPPTATCQFAVSGSLPGEFSFPAGIAVDNDPVSPSYGDVYVVDRQNFRVQKFSPAGQFLLMFGGEVDKTTHSNLCTAEDLEVGHDNCGAGVPGSGPGSPPSYFSWNFSEGGGGSIATGPAGVVYVGDFGRIQKFEPDGSFIGELSLPGATGTADLTAGSNQLTGLTTATGAFLVGEAISGTKIPPLTTIASVDEAEHKLTLSAPVEAGGTASGVALTVEPQFVTSLAVAPAGAANAGDIFERSISYGQGVIYQSSGGIKNQVPGVRELDPTGATIATFDATGAARDLSVDQAGDLFVGERTDPYEFHEYTPTGALFANFTSAEIPTRVSFGAFGSKPGYAQAIAAGDGALYAPTLVVGPEASGFESKGTWRIAVVDFPQAGPPLVKPGSETVSDLEPTTATLHAVVNPEGHETTYRFQYVDAADFEHNGEGFSSPATHETPSNQLELTIEDHAVVAPISSLTPETTYHFRAVAESECEPVAQPGQICEVPGEDVSFETLPPVSIRHFTTQTVGPELVTLKAELSPNNGAGTEYEVCIGAEEGVYTRCSSGPIHVLGNVSEEITATFEHLEPNTEYHYTLIAHNSYGIPVETADATFTTEESLAEQDAREACANTQLRSENNSLSLADCRAYEQVSPTAKSGQSVNQPLLAPSGDRSAFGSLGAFAGAEQNSGLFLNYLSHRTEAGWTTEAVRQRPADPAWQPRLLVEFNAELDHWVTTAFQGSNQWESIHSSPTGALYLGATDGSFLQASPGLSAVEHEVIPEGSIVPTGQSADLSHIFIQNSVRLLESDPLPDGGNSAPGYGNRLYEITGAGGPEPKLSLLAEIPTEVNEGDANCGINGGFEARANSSSADGSTVLYERPLVLVPGAGCPNPNKNALFARTGEAPPIQLSAESPSQCSSGHPCAGAAPAEARFYGASPDATRAWFSTEQPLVDADADPSLGAASNDLYLAKLENGQLTELVQASHGEPSDPTPGKGAGVQGVVRVSPDGAVIYFVATGVLTTEADPSSGQSARQGADNLYGYDSRTGQTRFISRLCSGPEASGSQSDAACPASLGTSEANDRRLWQPNGQVRDFERQAQTTPDGNYLLFDSYGRLAPGDTDGARDVYRYDLQTGELTRISSGRDGNDANGNDDAFDAEITGIGNRQYLEAEAEDSNRAISADGSTVVFTTAAPLVSRDTNAAPDVYQWQEAGHGSCAQSGGCISLVSSGLDPHGATSPVISSSGRDIVFRTTAGLVPADNDGAADIYDAREDGGFPFSPPETPCGSTEACHEAAPPTPPAPNLTTGGETGGNGVRTLQCAKGRHRTKRHGQVRCVPDRKHHHKKKHRRGKHHHKKHKRAGHNGGGGK